MSALILSPDDPTLTSRAMAGDRWLVACLCAAWCDVCTAFRPAFEALAQRHSDTRFLWIDVEDHAAVVGDFEIENFPTLLMQRGDTVAFYGTVPPDAQIAERIMTSLAMKSAAELAAEARSTEERRRWQDEANLRRAISPAPGERHDD